MKGFRDSILEINENALRHNLNYFASKISKEAGLILVLKANSYGAGAVNIAQLFEEESHVEYYAVASISEGVELRNNEIKKPIMILSPEGSQFRTAINNQLESVIISVDHLKKYLQEVKPNEQIDVHLNFDSGMHRVGFKPNEINELTVLLNEHKNVTVASVFSHYSSSGDKQFDEFTKTQSDTFKTMYTELCLRLDYYPKTHQNNSDGIERFGQDGNNLHRLGIGLYGLSEENAKLQNIFTWKTKVSHIQWVEKGESVSYNRSWIAPKRSKIVSCFVGYADSLNRRLSNGKWAFKFGEKRIPIVGDICMDLTMLDASEIDVEIGDDLIILNSIKDIETMADQLNTISYEILTSFSPRTTRIYLG